MLERLEPVERRRKCQQLTGIYPLADDDPRWPHGPKAVVEAAATGGARVVQLRLKHSSDREALALARWSRRICDDAGMLLFVNDRFDLAAFAEADGVHLGTDDCPPERVPEEIRAGLLIGLSTHTLEQVDASRTRPVDCIGFGPVFGTQSKTSGYSERGVPLLGQAVAQAAHPVVAIGGIGADQIAAVVRTGAAAAAVISAITASEEPAGPAHTVMQLQQAFSGAKPQP